jgi:hypothetical protein
MFASSTQAELVDAGTETLSRPNNVSRDGGVSVDGGDLIGISSRQLVPPNLKP